MDTVRIARDLGTVSHLLPEGVSSVRDLPYTLHRAIKMALTFLSFEELPPEDMPPRNIWLDGKALNEWFDDVRQRQKQKMDGREIDDPVRNGALDLLIVEH